MRIMDELNISPGALADPENRIRIGQKTSSRVLLSGHMVQSRDGMEVVCRGVDTETSQVLGTMDVFSDRSGMDQILNLAMTLSAKLHRGFPLGEGTGERPSAPKAGGCEQARGLSPQPYPKTRGAKIIRINQDLDFAHKRS